MAATQKHSSKSNEHYTPRQIVDAARKVMGGIDLDPATSLAANKLIGATDIFTYRNRGTTLADDTPWYGRVFCNPPGGKQPIRPDISRSNPAAFWYKLWREWESCRVTDAVFVGFSVEVMQTTQLLGCGAPSIVQFPFCIPRSRVKFDRMNRGQRVGTQQPPNASVIVYLGDYPQRFEREFQKIGEVRL